MGRSIHKAYVDMVVEDGKDNVLAHLTKALGVVHELMGYGNDDEERHAAALYDAINRTMAYIMTSSDQEVMEESERNDEESLLAIESRL